MTATQAHLAKSLEVSLSPSRHDNPDEYPFFTLQRLHFNTRQRPSSKPQGRREGKRISKVTLHHHLHVVSMSCISASQPDTSCSVPPHHRTATADDVLGSHSTTSVAVAQRSDTTSGVEDAGMQMRRKGFQSRNITYMKHTCLSCRKKTSIFFPTDSIASSPNTHIEKEAPTINLLRMAP